MLLSKATYNWDNFWSNQNQQKSIFLMIIDKVNVIFYSYLQIHKYIEDSEIQ